eukprot:1183433-Prorocentrum_minimum.AAC.3
MVICVKSYDHFETLVRFLGWKRVSDADGKGHLIAHDVSEVKGATRTLRTDTGPRQGGLRAYT